MAYNHFQHELVTKAASVATAAVIAEEMPGYQPFTLRAVALVFTTAPDAAGVVEINHRPTAGAAGAEVALDTIAYDATLGAAGKVVYVDGLDQKVVPGESIAVEVTTATPTVGTCNVILFVEATWEHPTNNTDMAESA